MTMTIHVLIRRQQPHESAPKTYRAWVTQEGYKRAMLCKGVKTLDECKAKAQFTLEKAAPGCEIEWEIEPA